MRRFTPSIYYYRNGFVTPDTFQTKNAARNRTAPNPKENFHA